MMDIGGMSKRSSLDKVIQEFDEMTSKIKKESYLPKCESDNSVLGKLLVPRIKIQSSSHNLPFFNKSPQQPINPKKISPGTEDCPIVLDEAEEDLNDFVIDETLLNFFNKIIDGNDKVDLKDKCGICQRAMENPTTLENCFHNFCFSCINTWTRKLCTCPTCDETFSCFYHNIKDDQTFEICQVEIGNTDEKTKSISEPECCSICLEDFDDRATLDGCLHNFCFKCISDWSTRKLICPLCNGKISIIYHNIKDDYTCDVFKPADINIIDRSLINQLINTEVYPRTTSYHFATNNSAEIDNSIINRVLPHRMLPRDMSHESTHEGATSGSIYNAYNVQSNSLISRNIGTLDQGNHRNACHVESENVGSQMFSLVTPACNSNGIIDSSNPFSNCYNAATNFNSYQQINTNSFIQKYTQKPPFNLTLTSSYSTPNTSSIGLDALQMDSLTNQHGSNNSNENLLDYRQTINTPFVSKGPLGIINCNSFINQSNGTNPANYVRPQQETSNHGYQATFTPSNGTNFFPFQQTSVPNSGQFSNRVISQQGTSLDPQGTFINISPHVIQPAHSSTNNSLDTSITNFEDYMNTDHQNTIETSFKHGENSNNKRRLNYWDFNSDLKKTKF